MIITIQVCCKNKNIVVKHFELKNFLHGIAKHGNNFNKINSVYLQFRVEKRFRKSLIYARSKYTIMNLLRRFIIDNPSLLMRLSCRTIYRSCIS